MESLAVGRELISCMSKPPAVEPCLGKRPGTLEGWESCGNTGATMCTGEAANRKRYGMMQTQTQTHTLTRAANRSFNTKFKFNYTY